MKSLIEISSASPQKSVQSSVAQMAEEVIESKSAAPRSSQGLTCLGVTIIKESKLSKLQENQPILLSNSNSDSDSLLNEISINLQQRCKLVENVFPGKLSN